MGMDSASPTSRIAAPQIVHLWSGQPRVVECEATPARCYLCGGFSERTSDVDSWMRDGFTSQTRVLAPESDRVCEACVWICSRTSPVPGRPPKDGKKLGGNFRNYSHVYDAGAATPYRNMSKGEKPALLAFLRAEKVGRWFAGIADSGQKHVLPFAPVNPAGARQGLVLFEERVITLPAPTSARWGLVDDTAHLLTAGATKEEIQRGDYGPRAAQLCGIEIRAFERSWGGMRGGTWFDLALWLSQRDEAAVAERLDNERAAKAGKKPRNAAKGA